MKSIHLTLLLLLLSLSAFAHAPQPTPDKPKPADLALLPSETESIAKILEADQTLTQLRASTLADLAEADKLLTSPNYTDKVGAYAAKKRRSGLHALKICEMEAKRLETESGKWLADVRKRAKCPTCTVDLNARTLVLPPDTANAPAITKTEGKQH